MSVLTSHINPNSEEFKGNYKFHTSLVKTLNEASNMAKKGGGEKAVKSHVKKGKMYVRDRIKKLIDTGTEFLELSSLAAMKMYDSQAPCAGIITGIGVIEGIRCMIVANDATVKGGAYFPLTVKKHLRAQEIAEINNLPCIYLVDSGGAFLPLQSEVYPDKEHFGRIFFNQARLSSKGIPQIAVVMGVCTAGGAYVPAMCHETIIVKNQGTIFLAGPPLVKAATGEDVTTEKLGGASMHTSHSGVADYLVENDVDALKKTRQIIKHLNLKRKHLYAATKAEKIKPPRVSLKDIYGIIPQDLRRIYEVREVLARVLDGSEFHEFKPDYGKTLICGFGHVKGFPVGIIANKGILFSESALKAVHFIELCEKREVPLAFFQNISGFMVGEAHERAGIAKHGAKMVTAVATSKIPKFTFIIGGSFGAGNYAMCGRAFNPRFLFSWPNSKISVMGGEQAAFVLSQIKIEQREKMGETLTKKEAEKIRAPILANYENEGSPYYATARLWDDGIIDPRDTREILCQCLESAQFGNWDTADGFGLFRM